MIINLGYKIKEYRHNNNLTQNELAQYLHVSNKTVSGWENNRSVPDMHYVYAMSNIFNISLNDFIKKDISNNHYKNMAKINGKKILLLKYSYILISFFLLLSYINMYNLYNIHIFIVPLILFIVEIIFMLNYVYKINRPLKITIFYFMFIIFNFILIFMNKYFLQDINGKSIAYVVGSTIGEFILNLCLSLGIIIIIFFNPFKSNRRFKI